MGLPPSLCVYTLSKIRAGRCVSAGQRPRFIDNYRVTVLAIGQTRAYIPCITGKDAIWRPWLREPTALPPFTAGARGGFHAVLHSHDGRPPGHRPARPPPAPPARRLPRGPG